MSDVEVTYDEDNKGHRLIDDACSELSLSDDIRQRSLELLHDIQMRSNRFSAKYRLDEIVCAVVYTAAREDGYPLPMKEVPRAIDARIDKSRYNKLYSRIRDFFDIDVKHLIANDYITYWSSKIRRESDYTVGEGEVAKAHWILERADDAKLSGANTAHLATTALFISLNHMTDQDVQKKEIADICGTSGYVIRCNMERLGFPTR